MFPSLLVYVEALKNHKGDVIIMIVMMLIIMMKLLSLPLSPVSISKGNGSTVPRSWGGL
jgi:hypothetical protein